MSEELVSTKGIFDGAPRTPLREFKGKFDGSNTRLDTRFTPNKTYVDLNFSELDVILSTEPYDFPIAQLSFPYNKRRVSQWTVFADSLNKLLKEDQDIRNTEGMMYHMKMTPGHMMWDREKGEATAREAWEIIAMEGAGTTPTTADATAMALELLDGKTESEWNQLVFQNPAVKGDGQLMSSIIQRTFLPAMETAGKVTKDENGVYHTKPLS